MSCTLPLASEWPGGFDPCPVLPPPVLSALWVMPCSLRSGECAVGALLKHLSTSHSPVCWHSSFLLLLLNWHIPGLLFFFSPLVFLRSIASEFGEEPWGPRIRLLFYFIVDQEFIFIYLFFPFIFISWRLIILQYCSVFCHTLTWNQPWIYMCSPSWTPSHLAPHPIPLGHPSAPALSTCLTLVICFTLDNIHVSMLFSRIIPPSPSPIESKNLFYTSVSLFLSWI